MRAGEPDQPLQIVAIGRRALRVGRRAEVERGGALEQLGAQPLEVGQKAGLGAVAGSSTGSAPAITAPP